MTAPLRSSARRRTTATCAALLLGLALTACGGGDDEAGDDPSPRASQSESVTGTTSPSEPTTSDSADSSDAPAGLPSEEQLEGALVTLDDVPAGFTVTPDDGEEDGDDPFDDTCLSEIGDFSDALGSEPEEEAEVELGTESPTTQSSVNAKISAYADAAGTASVFASFTDQLQTCTSVQASAEGVDYDFDIAYDDTVDVPGAEDQLAFDVTGTIASGEQSYPVTFRYVVALTGPFVSVIGVYALGEDTTGVLDSAQDLAVTQAERLAALG